MKLTNNQMLLSVVPLASLNDVKLPVKTSFKIARMSRVIDDHLKDYKSTLDKLQDKHAARDEAGEKLTDGKTMKLKDPEAYFEEFNELLNVENEMDFTTMKLDDLGEIEIEPSVLYHLNWLLEE